MLKFTKTDYPDADLYEERINSFGKIYFDKDRAIKILKYNEGVRATRRKQSEKILRVNSSNRYMMLDESYILDYLELIEFCPSYRFNSKKTVKGYTLDMKKVLGPLLEEGYAIEFLSAYTQYKSMKSTCSRIQKLTESMLESVGKSMDNSDLYEIKFTARPQVNLRFNYSNYDIITIPKEYNSCVCVPKGRYLVWGDFKNSDLRIDYNLFLRDESNAEIMDSCDDKYEGMARILANKENTEFDLDAFKEDRDTFKINVLAPTYGQVKGKTEKDQIFIDSMNRFLLTCPRYQEFKKRLADRQETTLPLVVTSYFGHDEIIQPGYNANEAINTALNSPIQTGTSEMVILVTNTILDKFYELGYTEDDVNVYYNRHDEPIFNIAEKALKDAWIFKECSEILVDNWSPLELEFHYGFRYKEVAKTIEDRVESIYNLNKDKITHYEMNTSTEYDYYPLAKTLKLHVGLVKLGESQTIITLYNEDINTVKYYGAPTVDDNEIIQAVKNYMINYTSNIAEKGYATALLYNNICDFELFENDVYIKSLVKNTNGIGKATVLANLYANLHYPDAGDKVALASIYKTNKHWIDSIHGVKLNNALVEEATES